MKISDTLETLNVTGTEYAGIEDDEIAVSAAVLIF